MPSFCKKHILLLIMILAVFACKNNKDRNPINSIVIEITGEEFNWHYRYPGPDGILGNTDDAYSTQDLYLPSNSRVQLKLKSKDYVYTFALPDMGLKEIAVPDLEFELNFKTGNEKELQVLGDQFCGFAHASLIGKAFVRDQSDGFYDWSDSTLTQTAH